MFLRDQTQPPGFRYGLGAVGGVELAVDAGGMSFDGSRGDDELPGDLPVRLAKRHEVEDFQLALAQRLGQIGGGVGFIGGRWI